MLCLTLLSGCVTPYVDTTLHDLTTDEKVKVANPQPVQLLFDFQTKGVHNGQGTDLAKMDVLAAIQDGGLFSQLSNDPVPNGAILNVVVNNVPLTDDAFAKGFTTGLTLGLVGNTVGDGYICTVEYLPGAKAQKISKTMNDAIYTSLGATAEAPQHAQKMPGLQQAFKAMVHKLVENTVNEVGKDPAFTATAAMASR
jgi:hypothetical protein